MPTAATGKLDGGAIDWLLYLVAAMGWPLAFLVAVAVTLLALGRKAAEKAAEKAVEHTFANRLLKKSRPQGLPVIPWIGGHRGDLACADGTIGRVGCSPTCGWRSAFRRITRCDRSERWRMRLWRR